MLQAAGRPARVPPGRNLICSPSMASPPLSAEGGSRPASGARLPCLLGRPVDAQEDCSASAAHAFADVEGSRAVLSQARHLILQGSAARASDLLVRYFEAAGLTPMHGSTAVVQNPQLEGVQQEMLATCCGLLNDLARQHLRAAKVARAFACTRTCEKWLQCRRGQWGDSWLKLKLDCCFNAAELAKSMDDLPQVVTKLSMCARLQGKMRRPEHPETVYLSLAEALLQCERFAEAAQAARTTVRLLGGGSAPLDERARYASVLALTLEQAALASLDPAAEPGCGDRALDCLAEAESLVAHAVAFGFVDQATRGLLNQMRRLQEQMPGRRRAGQDAADGGSGGDAGMACCQLQDAATELGAEFELPPPAGC